ncbi:MAG TPA: glucose 1-dehydrogenase [Nocardioidaceae bacterium]|nr:glucose 1-dehydrogenase [Nocardioidaceae bacterium]
MRKLEGRVAVVTGGARGIGAATARLFAAEGAKVVIADVLTQEGEALAREIGDAACYVHLDVTSEVGWRETVELAEREFGPVSILVNNAGIVDFGTIADQDYKAFQHVLDVNLVGPWLGMHVTVPSLRRAGGGAIVNVSSTAGLMGYSNLGGYVASKWGLRGLTKTAALELAPDEVRVCSIHPGPIRTPMTSQFDDSMTAAQPIARFGEPDEVAKMALFVVADATYSTGCEFVIDGGATVGSLLVADAE